MGSNAEVVARIRKILAKTEEAGCTAAEAEAAFGLASSLMARHNLDMAEVELSAGLDGEGWADEIVHVSGRASAINDLIGGLCSEFFFVESFRYTRFNNNKLKWECVERFFGSPTNIEAARFIFSSLLSAIDRLWKEAFRQGRFERKDRRVFALGVINGYSEKLRKERASMIQERDKATSEGGTALALQTIEDKTHAALEAVHPNLETTRTPRFYGSRESYEGGVQAGRNLNLSRPLEGSSGPLGLPRK